MKDDKSFDINLVITPIRNGYLVNNIYYPTLLECLREHISRLDEESKKKKFNLKININEQ